MKNILKNQLIWAGAVFVLLVGIILWQNKTGVFAYINGKLTSPLIDIMQDAPPIMMIALGMTLVIATKGIDLSVGSVMAVAGATAMQFLASSSNGDSAGAATMAFVMAVLAGLACGLVSGFLVSVVKLQPFITTLIMMILGRGIANVITNGKNTPGNSPTFNWITQGRVFGIPVGFILGLVILIAVSVAVRKTALGLNIEAVGINPRAAEMAGIRSSRIIFMVYVISGILAAIGGCFAVAQVGTVEVNSTGTGAALEMDAILAVVIGGTSLAGGKFHIGGSFLGALIVVTLTPAMVYIGVSAPAVPAVKAVVIIFICLLQSERLRGWFTRPGGNRPEPVLKADKTETTKAVAA